MSIVTLAEHHEEALQDFLQAFDDGGEANIPAYFAERNWDHATIVQALDDWSKGEQLEPGWVPCSTRFFERDGQLLGVYNFRHHLNDELREEGGHVGYSVRPDARGEGVATALLRHARQLGKEHGLDHLLVTCRSTNVPSVRVIERNGGVKRDTVVSDYGRDTVHFDVPVLDRHS